MHALFYLFALGASFVASLLLTPLAISLAYRWRVLDRPGARKIHGHPTPYLGGVALFISASLVFFSLAPLHELRLGAAMAALVSALLVLAWGLLDDLSDMKPGLKFRGQSLLALAFCLGIARFEVLHLPGFEPLALGWLGLPLTWCFLQGMINGFNMIDGSDGLAGLAAAASLLIIAALAALLGRPELQFLALCGLGASFGFLAWNRAPARIYLGDAGSQGLGMLVAALILLLGNDGPRWAFNGAPAAQLHLYQVPLAFLVAGFPMVEVLSTIMRRYLSGRSLVRGDHGHLHNRLLLQGLGPNATALCAALYSLLGGSVAAAVLAGNQGLAVLLLMLWAGITALGFTVLGYTRFFERRWLQQRRPHFELARHFIGMHKIKAGLAHDGEEQLQLLERAAEELGVVRLRLELGARPGRRAWSRDWRSPKGPRPGSFPQDHYRLPEGGAQLLWSFDSEPRDPEMALELKVLMAEVARDFLPRILQEPIKRAKARRAPVATLASISRRMGAQGKAWR